jgi:hypothetical protein
MQLADFLLLLCATSLRHNRVSAEGWVYCEGDTPNLTYLNLLVSVLVRCLCLLPMTLRVCTADISKLYTFFYCCRLICYDHKQAALPGTQATAARTLQVKARSVTVLLCFNGL